MQCRLAFLLHDSFLFDIRLIQTKDYLFAEVHACAFDNPLVKQTFFSYTKSEQHILAQFPFLKGLLSKLRAMTGLMLRLQFLGRLLLNEEALQLFLADANEKMKRNFERIERLRGNVKKKR